MHLRAPGEQMLLILCDWTLSRQFAIITQGYLNTLSTSTNNINLYSRPLSITSHKIRPFNRILPLPELLSLSLPVPCIEIECTYYCTFVLVLLLSSSLTLSLKTAHSLSTLSCLSFSTFHPSSTAVSSFSPCR